jgi:hypothetical protein
VVAPHKPWLNKKGRKGSYIDHDKAAAEEVGDSTETTTAVVACTAREVGQTAFSGLCWPSPTTESFFDLSATPAVIDREGVASNQLAVEPSRPSLPGCWLSSGAESVRILKASPPG